MSPVSFAILATALAAVLGSAQGCTTLYADSFYANIDFTAYPNNVDICYEIRASSNKKVEVYTTTLSTEGCFDYLTIRCEDSSGDLIDHYCNAETVNDVVSGGRQMYVRFYSDSSNVGSGFTLYYREVSQSTNSDCDGASSVAVSITTLIAALFLAVMKSF